MNITVEPVKWFDLVLACGLADVRAGCLHDLLQSSGENRSLPSVENLAKSLIPRFGEVFRRDMMDLKEEGGEEVEELRNLVDATEEAARKENEEKGGWATEPDLSGRAVRWG